MTQLMDIKRLGLVMFVRQQNRWKAIHLLTCLEAVSDSMAGAALELEVRFKLTALYREKPWVRACYATVNGSL